MSEVTRTPLHRHAWIYSRHPIHFPCLVEELMGPGNKSRDDNERFAWPSSRLFQEAPVDQGFGDLDGIERRALAQIIRNNPDVQAIINC